MFLPLVNAQEHHEPEEQVQLRAWLFAAYPDLQGRALQIQADQTRAGLAFAVSDVTDVKGIIKDRAALRVAEGAAQFDAQHRLRTFSAHGRLLKAADNLALTRAMDAARQADGDADAEVTARSVRFGPGQGEALVSQTDWRRLGDRLGSLTIKGTAPRRDASTSYGFLWDVTVVALQGDGTSAQYVLSFEPFEGRLVSVAGR